MSRRATAQKRALEILAAASLAGIVRASDVTSSWIGPASSTESWSNPTNWSNTPGVAHYPNNGNGGLTYDALVNSTGTLILSETINLNRLTLASGIIDGANDLVINEQMTWNNAGMRGGGTTTIMPSATLNLAGIGWRPFTRTIDNFGTTNWTDGGITGDMAAGLGTFNNKFGATFLANCRFQAFKAIGNGTFNNDGVILKTTDNISRFGGVTTVNSVGTVDIHAGWIQFYGPVVQASTPTLTGGTWIIDSTAFGTSTQLYLADAPPLTAIAAAARVELRGAAAYFGKLYALADNHGVFAMRSGQTFTTAADFTNSGTTIVGSTSLLRITGNLANTGTIDITGGMIVDYDTSTPRAMIESQIVSARNGGAWDNPGITSSAAIAAPATTLGVLEATEFKLIYGPDEMFFGQTLDTTSLLVKYTYYGDTDFNGVVDFDDYVRTDTGYNTGLTGWSNGDNNLDGTIDFDDYVLMDAAYNTQSGTLIAAMNWLEGDDRSARHSTLPGVQKVIEHYNQFGTTYSNAFYASVPEPTVGMIVIGAAPLLRRRSPRTR